MEVAEAFATRGLTVSIVEMMDTVVPAFLDEVLAYHLEKHVYPAAPDSRGRPAWVRLATMKRLPHGRARTPSSCRRFQRAWCRRLSSSQGLPQQSARPYTGPEDLCFPNAGTPMTGSPVGRLGMAMPRSVIGISRIHSEVGSDLNARWSYQGRLSTHEPTGRVQETRSIDPRIAAFRSRKNNTKTNSHRNSMLTFRQRTCEFKVAWLCCSLLAYMGRLLTTSTIIVSEILSSPKRPQGTSFTRKATW